MTPEQRDTLRFIRKYMAKNEIGPSYTEICEGVNITSRSAAHRLVHGLAAQGLVGLTKGSGRNRAIKWVAEKAA